MATTPTKPTKLPEDVKSPQQAVAMLATTLKDTANTSVVGQSKLVQILSSKTGVETHLLVWASGVVALACILMGWGINLASQVIGFAYPSYSSIKALDSSDPAVSRKWLTYWIVYGWFNVLEYFADYVLYWLPFYYPLKICFLVFLMMEKFEGSKVIFEKAIQPAVKISERTIVRAIDDVVSAPAVVKAAPAAAPAAKKEEAAPAPVPKTATTDFYDNGGVDTNTTDAPPASAVQQRASVEATDMD